MNAGVLVAGTEGLAVGAGAHPQWNKCKRRTNVVGRTCCTCRVRPAPSSRSICMRLPCHNVSHSQLAVAAHGVQQCPDPPHLQAVLPHRHLDVQLSEGTRPVGPVLNLRPTRSRHGSVRTEQAQDAVRSAECGALQQLLAPPGSRTPICKPPARLAAPNLQARVERAVSRRVDNLQYFHAQSCIAPPYHQPTCSRG